MQAPIQHQTTGPLRSTLRRLRGRETWAFAAAFAVTVAAVGIAALALRGDKSLVDDAPSVTAVAGRSSDVISVDSLAWTRINLGTEGPGLHITAGGPGLVAVGTYPEADPNDLADGGGGPGWVQGYFAVPTVWTSSDGYEWSQVPSREDTIGVLDFDGELAGIAGRDDVLVAVAENYAWTTPDGLKWSRIPEGTFHNNVHRLNGVITGGPGFIAFGEVEVSQRSAIWTSPDGYTWRRVPDDPAAFSADIHAMTVGGPGLVAVGSSHGRCTPVVWTSPDGYSWARLPHDPAVFGADPVCGLWGPGQARIRDVSTGGPGVVAVGSFEQQAAVWTSPDGVTWTRVPDDPALPGVPPDMPYSEMIGVAAIGDGLVAIGTRGGEAAAWTSRDGFAWTDITDDFDLTGDAGMVQVIAGGPGVVILGEELIADYIDRPPLIETVMWIGSPSE